MMYQKMQNPPRYNHLWKYTPWKEIAPSKLSESPEFEDSTISFLNSKSKVEVGFSLSQIKTETSTIDDIARSCLSQESVETNVITLSGSSEIINLRVDANSAFSVCKIHFDVKQSSKVCIEVVGNADWFGLMVSANVAPNAHFDFGYSEKLSESCRVVRCEDWKIGRSSVFNMATLSTHSLRRKSDIRISLEESSSEFYGSVAIHGIGSKKDDTHIEIDHKVGNTFSDLSIKTACDDRSRSISTGRLYIREGADGVDSGQVFRNLLLSEKARADSIPELEVYADDVAARHGAASAPVDENLIYYLMSRGLNRETAVSTLVEGFLADAFSNLSSDSLREEMRTRLRIHLDCLAHH